MLGADATPSIALANGASLFFFSATDSFASPGPSSPVNASLTALKPLAAVPSSIFNFATMSDTAVAFLPYARFASAKVSETLAPVLAVGVAAPLTFCSSPRNAAPPRRICATLAASLELTPNSF